MEGGGCLFPFYVSFSSLYVVPLIRIYNSALSNQMSPSFGELGAEPDLILNEATDDVDAGRSSFAVGLAVPIPTFPSVPVPAFNPGDNIISTPLVLPEGFPSEPSMVSFLTEANHFQNKNDSLKSSDTGLIL